MDGNTPLIEAQGAMPGLNSLSPSWWGWVILSGGG